MTASGLRRQGHPDRGRSSPRPGIYEITRSIQKGIFEILARGAQIGWLPMIIARRPLTIFGSSSMNIVQRKMVYGTARQVEMNTGAAFHRPA